MCKYRNALAGIPILLLVACGGGSTSGGPAASAPPPPAPRTNSTLTNLTVSQTFDTASGSIGGHLSSIVGTPSSVSSQQSDLGSAVSISYNAGNDSYTISTRLPGDTDSATFGTAQYNVDESTSEVAYYTQTRGNEEHQLVLFRPGNVSKPLSYVTYGGWQRLTPRSGVDFSTTFFIFGIRTETADMPSTGTAGYSATVEGVWTDPLSFNTLAGTAYITADFAASTVKGDFDLAGRSLGGDVRPFDKLTGNASITGNTFSGLIAGVTTDYFGDWAGGFFGPNAAEIGGSFRVTDDGRQAIGVFVGN